MMALSNKHKAFIDEYFINGFVASKAYLTVYKGVTEETAVANGSRLLTNANVKIEIDRRQAEIKAKYEINRDEIVEITKRIMNDNEKIAPPFALKAIEILNKMAGLNAAEKIDHTIKTEQPLFSDDDLKKLD